MRKKKLALTKDIVKYIFSGTNPEVAVGEDGYIVYGFHSIYPAELGIFVPIEIDRSNYSNVFPRTFESYFRDLDADIACLSRLLEVRVFSRLSNLGIEYVSGAVLKRDDGNYTIFRIDELIGSNLKTDLLCRVDTKRLGELDLEAIASINPYFLPRVSKQDSNNYLYFITQIGELFDDNEGLLAAVFIFSQSMSKI